MATGAERLGTILDWQALLRLFLRLACVHDRSGRQTGSRIGLPNQPPAHAWQNRAAPPGRPVFWTVRSAPGCGTFADRKTLQLAICPATVLASSVAARWWSCRASRCSRSFLGVLTCATACSPHPRRALGQAAEGASKQWHTGDAGPESK